MSVPKTQGWANLPKGMPVHVYAQILKKEEEDIVDRRVDQEKAKKHNTSKKAKTVTKKLD